MEGDFVLDPTSGEVVGYGGSVPIEEIVSLEERVVLLAQQMIAQMEEGADVVEGMVDSMRTLVR